MDYYLIYYYLLLLTLLLSLLLLLLHHLYARVPALHSTAFNCTIPPAMKKEIYTIYTITVAEQPPSPTISVYDIHFHLSAGGTYRGTAWLGRRQLKFHSLFTFFLPRSLRLFRWEISATRAKERGDFTARLQSYSREMANDAVVRRKKRIVIHHYNSIRASSHYWT